jgi:hypothetical protein
MPIADLQPSPGADGLEVEILAGGLLAMVKTMDAAQKDTWRQGAARSFAKHRQLKVELQANWKRCAEPRPHFAGTKRNGRGMTREIG